MENTTLIAIFGFSFVLAIGAVMSPGPVSTAIMSQAPRMGWRVGPLISIGHSILELLVVLALAFGLQSILSQPGIETSISFLGGLLLIWMGYAILKSVYKKQLRLPQSSDNPSQHSQRQIVWLGIGATLANPFWYAWWVSVPSAYLAQARNIGLLPLAAFYFGHISADFLWNSILAGAIGGSRRWMTNKIYAFILGGCALFFVYLGLVFLQRGWMLIKSF